jgi:hypothetical protein
MASDVWVAIGSGVLGAVVGGIFSTIAAALQVKALFRATTLEMSITLSQERQLRNEEYRERALTESLTVILQIEAATYEVCRDHEHDPSLLDRACDHRGLSNNFPPLRAELRRCISVYSNEVLTEEACHPMAWLVDTLDILCGDDASQLPGLVSDLMPENDQDQYCWLGQASYCSEHFAVEARSALGDELKKHRRDTHMPPALQ